WGQPQQEHDPQAVAADGALDRAQQAAITDAARGPIAGQAAADPETQAAGQVGRHPSARRAQDWAPGKAGGQGEDAAGEQRDAGCAVQPKVGKDPHGTRTPRELQRGEQPAPEWQEEPRQPGSAQQQRDEPGAAALAGRRATRTPWAAARGLGTSAAPACWLRLCATGAQVLEYVRLRSSTKPRRRAGRAGGGCNRLLAQGCFGGRSSVAALGLLRSAPRWSGGGPRTLGV